MNELLCITLPIGPEVEQKLRRCCSDGVTFMQFSYPQIALFKGQQLSPSGVATILKIAVLLYIHNSNQTAVSANVLFYALMNQFTDVLIPHKGSADAVKAYCGLTKKYWEDDSCE